MEPGSPPPDTGIAPGPTIDMTLDGRLLAPPSRWTRMRNLWQSLPRGSLPALLSTIVVALFGLLLVLGVLVALVPILVVLGVVAIVFRPRPARRMPTFRAAHSRTNRV